MAPPVEFETEEDVPPEQFVLPLTVEHHVILEKASSEFVELDEQSQEESSAACSLGSIAQIAAAAGTRRKHATAFRFRAASAYRRSWWFASHLCPCLVAGPTQPDDSCHDDGDGCHGGGAASSALAAPAATRGSDDAVLQGFVRGPVMNLKESAVSVMSLNDDQTHSFCDDADTTNTLLPQLTANELDEKYGKGFKLMEALGYAPGQRLGRVDWGLATPVSSGDMLQDQSHGIGCGSSEQHRRSRANQTCQFGQHRSSKMHELQRASMACISDNAQMELDMQRVRSDSWPYMREVRHHHVGRIQYPRKGLSRYSLGKVALRFMLEIIARIRPSLLGRVVYTTGTALS